MNEPLSSNTVTRQVIEKIKSAILEGELKPGDKLPTEGELCGMWQVSRTPIREAIKVLEFMGILEIRRSEGTFVCRRIKPAVVNPLVFKLLFLADSAQQFLEFRREVERMVLRLAIEKATSADIDLLEDSIHQMEEALSRNADPDTLLALELAFHESLAGATGNALIREMAGEIFNVFASSVRNSHAHGGGPNAVEHHKRLLDAVSKRDMGLGEHALEEALMVWTGYLDTLPISDKE